MKYVDRINLYESKDSIINKLNNLTNEQKEEVKAFFNKHNEQEKKVDWNNTEDLTYDNFKKIMDDFKNRNTISAQKKIANKQGIEGLTDGKDYKYLGEYTTSILGTFRAYVPLSWLGAKTIAGRKVPPINEDKDSAAWCIGYSSDIKFWNQYFHDYNDSFVIICGDEVPTKKVCFEIKNSEFSDIICWDYYDEDFSLSDLYAKALKLQDKKDFSSEEKLETDNILYSLFDKSIELSDARRPIDKQEQEEAENKRQKAFEQYVNSLPTKNYTFNGCDFPFIQVGERPEGKVFMSKYLTDITVPFSPIYLYNKYDRGCNRWDVSILRQWLNSDAPAGQWYQEVVVEGYKVDWDKTPDTTKEFIRTTPGFLKMVGISKSDLNPVTNITYTSEGTPIKTIDYVWVQSLSEMNCKDSNKNEGEPLEYWKHLLRISNASVNNKNRIMHNCRYSFSNYYYSRTAYDIISSMTYSVTRLGDISLGLAKSDLSIAVTLSFKE